MNPILILVLFFSTLTAQAQYREYRGAGADEEYAKLQKKIATLREKIANTPEQITQALPDDGILPYENISRDDSGAVIKVEYSVKDEQSALIVSYKSKSDLENTDYYKCREAWRQRALQVFPDACDKNSRLYRRIGDVSMAYAGKNDPIITETNPKYPYLVTAAAARELNIAPLPIPKETGWLETDRKTVKMEDAKAIAASGRLQKRIRLQACREEMIAELKDLVASSKPQGSESTVTDDMGNTLIKVKTRPAD